MTNFGLRLLLRIPFVYTQQGLARCLLEPPGFTANPIVERILVDRDALGRRATRGRFRVASHV